MPFILDNDSTYEMPLCLKNQTEKTGWNGHRQGIMLFIPIYPFVSMVCSVHQ